MMNSKELKAHIILLDDTDENVYQSIIDNLINEGSHIIPFLEKEWEVEEEKILFPFYLSNVLRKPALGIEPSVLFGLSKALKANITGFIGENNNLIIRLSVNLTK